MVDRHSGSFDTYSNQRGQHDSLLRELAEALAAFRNSIREAGLWDRVLVTTYSEFGRRVAENGSAGTDHGRVGLKPKAFRLALPCH